MGKKPAKKVQKKKTPVAGRARPKKTKIRAPKMKKMAPKRSAPAKKPIKPAKKISKRVPAKAKGAGKMAKAVTKPSGKPSKALIESPKPVEFISPRAPQLLLPAPAPETKKQAPTGPIVTKLENIEPIPEIKPEPEKPKPVLFQSHENRGGALAVEVEPALDMLPAWEDRIRLRRMIFEDGLKFHALSRSSPDFGEAFSLLAKTGRRGFRDVPGYYMICTRDRDGRIIGAMDVHHTGDIVVLGRSAAGGSKRRDLHILMYAAALFGKNPKYVVFAADKKPLDFDYAGELILLGRGFGMSALSLEKIVFIRRMKKELDPLSSGAEISSILSSMVPFLPSLGAASIEYSSKGIVALVPLPTSPDSREHLHELRDAAEALGIKSEKMGELVDELKSRYVLGREDVTPELV